MNREASDIKHSFKDWANKTPLWSRQLICDFVRLIEIKIPV